MLVNAELLKRFGLVDGDILSGKYDYHFKEVYSASLDLMPDDISKEVGINAVFIIALHRALEGKQVSFIDFKNMIISIYKEMLAPVIKKMEEDMAGASDPLVVFGEMVMMSNKDLYETEYFKGDIIQADKHGYHVDIHRCLHVDIFKRNDALELAPILCEYDWILAGAAMDWVIFIREETIAAGDPRCTFRYYPKKDHE